MTVDERWVTGPGLLCVIIVLMLWMTLRDRDRQIPFFDAGVFCALAILVYTVYPLINYWAGGLQFGPLSDPRLQLYNISSEELGFFHFRHVLYLFSFVVFYLAFRGSGGVEIGNIRAPRRSTRDVIIFFFLLLTGYFLLLQLMTGANYNTSYESDGFTKNLSVLWSLPTLLLQISSKLYNILFVFKLALLALVIERSRSQKWLFVLILWVAAEIMLAFFLKGGRSGLVMFLVATAMFYHRMIRPLTGKFLLVSGFLLFAFFLLFGLYRGDSGPFQADWSLTKASIFSGSNEFQALLGTAYDVFQRKMAGVDLPWFLHINDFIAILPPQQLMPFEKVGAAEWYMGEIGFGGTAQGLMWGVISQSIVGWDWLELALRGAILGLILAKLHRLYLKYQTSFLATLLYVYLCLRVYYTFRETTFSLLSNFVWEIIPFYLLLCIGKAIISRKVARQTDLSEVKFAVKHNGNN
jgi:hypothetical protein